ncbi:CmpA/NrtA family ABC transporter substrate-binding protein [Microbulbifer halophilus]|uniref:CmpA/NrtA family ABC transporter substrate-binding protein n=1 Tax=Microbulbifer halophilus TaxID=453963 RepID=A0ABW5ECA6_9GAMM|nr:CmpA/NrtA family ABC transporter substrate-binding protein [Microbulbifer halophilus]MCW8125813.1 CmpA/NrtA family ABC transporter substrate-binding protein [Microbulbifer halophilus]
MTAATPLKPEKPRLKLLYLRLTDSAPLIVAREMGFFSRFGLDVALQRETSWATLRDRLIGGAADAAAMLAPMPLTLKQALPHCEEKLLTGLILSCNGNAITLSRKMHGKLGLAAADSGAAGSALAAYLQRRTPGTAPLKLATVYPFSSHTLQLRHWLRGAGIDPDRDLQIQVLPPEQMVARLERGEIDGYCVGEPWNTIAAQRGLGTIVTTCNALLPAMPEKVLAATESWHQRNPLTHLALRAALLQACDWLADRAQRRDVAAILARGEYLDLDAESLTPSLNDQLQARSGQPPSANPDWHLFAHTDSDCGRPDADKAQQLLGLCERFSPISAGAEKAFRADLYQQTLDFLQRRK